MPSLHRRTRWTSTTLLIGLLWVSPATVAPFTATWNDAPTSVQNDGGLPTPFYDCPTWGGGGLVCRWMWDQGLEVSAETHLMYGDGNASYDAFGPALPLEFEIGSGGGEVLGIIATCRPGLYPCFTTFTPRSIEVGDPGAGVFFRSSRGGLIKALGGGRVDFAGADWTDITGMQIGLYRPDACDDDSDAFCEAEWLDLYSLTFDATPIPEPTSMLLVGTGLLAVLRRYRRP